MEKQIDIHIFGMNDKLFQQLFPEKQNSIDEKDIGKIENRKKIIKIPKSDEDWNLFVPFIIESNRSKYTIIWNAFNYPKLLDNNYRKILKYFFKRINIEDNKNNIVIKFNNTYMKDFSSIINKIQKNKPFLLFVLENDEYNENEFNNFKLPQYISYTKDLNNYNDEKELYIFAGKINSYLMEKQAYFSELDSTFENLFRTKCFIECNILLIGESRAGKSSFINKIFNKLVSHEDANLESVTDYSSEYTLSKGNAGINIIDTPGIIRKSNIKFIKKILDEYFEKIHLIYFFIKGQSNLEYCIDILEYIKLKNQSNFKSGKKKIPIIFIKNGEDLEINNETPAFFKYLKGELIKNNLLELYDDKYNKKKINDLENKINELDDEDLFNDNEDIENNYDNYCDGNIIQIYIPKGKNINKIFWISKEYLIENNLFLYNEVDNQYIQMEEYTKNLIKLFIKEKLEKNELNDEEKKEKKEFLKKCNDYADKRKKECSLIYDLNIKKIGILKESLMWLALFPNALLTPFILLPGLLLPSFIIYEYCKSIRFLASNTLFLNQYGFDEKDLIKYDLKKYLIKKDDDKKEENIINEEKEKENIVNDDNNDNKKKKLNKEDIEKSVRKKYEETAIFFQKLSSFLGPIQLLIKAKEISKELFDLFEELKNRKEKEWISYKIHKI